MKNKWSKLQQQQTNIGEDFTYLINVRTNITYV